MAAEKTFVMTADSIREIAEGVFASGIVSRVKDDRAQYGVREYSGENVKHILLTLAKTLEAKNREIEENRGRLLRIYEEAERSRDYFGDLTPPLVRTAIRNIVAEAKGEQPRIDIHAETPVADGERKRYTEKDFEDEAKVASQGQNTAELTAMLTQAAKTERAFRFEQEMHESRLASINRICQEGMDEAQKVFESGVEDPVREEMAQRMVDALSMILVYVTGWDAKVGVPFDAEKSLAEAVAEYRRRMGVVIRIAQELRDEHGEDVRWCVVDDYGKKIIAAANGTDGGSAK